MQRRDDGTDVSAGSGIHVLEASGMLDTMLHLRDVGQCKKTELYAAIGKRAGMAPKLDRLEDAGLIIQDRRKGMTVLLLSEKGCTVADLIEGIRQVMGEGEVREDRSLCPAEYRDVTFTGSGTRKSVLGKGIPWVPRPLGDPSTLRDRDDDSEIARFVRNRTEHRVPHRRAMTAASIRRAPHPPRSCIPV